MSDIPISCPGRYAPGVAIAFDGGDATAQTVSPASPLPVSFASVGGPAPMAGTANTATVAGPFDPVPGRPLVLALTGAWTGTVALLRSTDGGATKLPLSLAGAPWAQFASNVCEAVWEESEAAATFYLDLAPVSGTIAYRLAQ